jgi:hypothetical protein
MTRALLAAALALAIGAPVAAMHHSFAAASEQYAPGTDPADIDAARDAGAEAAQRKAAKRNANAPVAAQAEANPVQRCVIIGSNAVQTASRAALSATSPTNTWMMKRLDRIIPLALHLGIKKNMELTAGGKPVDCDKEAAGLLDYVLHGDNE